MLESSRPAPARGAAAPGARRPRPSQPRQRRAPLLHNTEERAAAAARWRAGAAADAAAAGEAEAERDASVAAAFSAVPAVRPDGPRRATGDRPAQLVLLRHGQSMFNDKELFSGDVDIPLTEEGTMEAIAGGKTFAHIDFDIIITSRLVRARMTALLAMTQNASGQVPIHVRGGLEGAPGPEVGRQKLRENALLAIDKAECDMVPLYSQKDLNERCYGDLQGLNKRQAAETFGDDVVRKWRRSVDTRPPGGESLHDTAIRSRAFFKDFVLPRLSAGQNVLLVAHGNSLRSVIAYVAGLTEEESIRLQLATAAPIMYNYDGEKFSHTNHQSKWKLDKPQFLTSTLKLSHGDSLV